MSTKSKKRRKQARHHTESSRSHNARREHDRKARAHNSDVYASSGASGNGSGMSRNTRWVLAGIAVVLVLSLTLMFIAGWIEW